MDLVVAVSSDIKIIFCIASFLFIWGRTDFLYSYLNLVGYRNEDYEEVHQEVNLSFIDFLLSQQTNRFLKFLFSLVSCPFCLSFWICVITAYPNALDFGYFYLGSLTVFGFMCKIFPND